MVFNPVSWQTHLLNDSAVRAVDALTSGPKSLDDVVAAICGGASPSDLSAEERQVGEALLAELETLGLVAAIDERLPPCD